MPAAPTRRALCRPAASTRGHIAVALLSVALIAFQLVLMQVLSLVQWYHFAYMVISVALLGFGAAGTLIALARVWMLRRFEALVPVLMLACGATMATVTGLSQQPFARFDAYLLFVDAAHAGSLAVTYLLFFIPFFLGALAIGLVFVWYAAQVGTYYFANLLGSGLGGLVAVVLLHVAAPPALPALVALFPVAAALVVRPRRHRRAFRLAALAGGALSLCFLLRPPRLVLSEYKDLSRTLALPEARIVLARSSPHGFLQVVASPALRHAPGLSLSYTGTVPPQEAVFNNGNWFGAVTAWSRTDTTHLLDFTTSALPYALGPREWVLVLEARTGERVAQALTNGAGHVTAVEPNRAAVDLMRHELAARTDSLFHHPALAVRVAEPRAFLAADTATYDLIVLPTTGAFGGTVGFSALQEQYTLTKEALRTMWHRLRPHGALALSTWLDYPYRHPLRLLATLVEVLQAEGASPPERHLAAVRGWGTITFVLTRSPLPPDAPERVRRFADRLGFDPVLPATLRPPEHAQYNRLQDDRFFAYVDTLLAPARDGHVPREHFYATYAFRVRPATDNRPYFDQFVRWRSLPHLAAQFGERTVPFLELGLLVVGLTLLQLVAAAMLLILLPLWRLGWREPGKPGTLLYFGGLGLGYLFVEMVLIQQFTLYLGTPLYAAAAVISVILICSGAGSYVSERFTPRPPLLRRVAGLIALLLFLYVVVLPPLLGATIALAPGLKALVTLLLLAPPAFVMGFPFPLGLRRLARHRAGHVPWAWGINGCLSVVSTALATLLAVEAGFAAVMVAAAAAYLLAAFSVPGGVSGS
ncbi:hypothetical protein GQ464_010570 [Rhodocaloribacter litoris]|uniref:spermidine synthase-like protein n=1 Tax=Rhodocaloribacter litoris TaxID=2558931 RepID=UPI001420D411|nr:spermidine synthase-like protein [Rhodocaloribacter litoris]QXD13907.1 hypothetical protein GQ464_010570 [Rhodocaloribacter litoris]